jgi:hypothetical protein
MFSQREKGLPFSYPFKAYAMHYRPVPWPYNSLLKSNNNHRRINMDKNNQNRKRSGDTLPNPVNDNQSSMAKPERNRQSDTEFDHDLFTVKESKVIQVNHDDERTTDVRRRGEVPQENLSVSEYSNKASNPHI